MTLIELILKERKLKGISWDKLAETLPINGDSLRIAFKRNSVNPAYLDVVCKILNIRQSEQNINETVEEEVLTYNTKEISLQHQIDLLHKKVSDQEDEIEKIRILLKSMVEQKLTEKINALEKKLFKEAEKE